MWMQKYSVFYKSVDERKMTGRWDIIRWVGGAQVYLKTEEKELVYREKNNNGNTGWWTEQEHSVGGGNRVGSSGEGLAVETVAKEENQGGHRNTWETEKDEVEDYMLDRPSLSREVRCEVTCWGWGWGIRSKSYLAQAPTMIHSLALYWGRWYLL